VSSQLPVDQFHFRLSPRKERDITISFWITENREHLNISEHIKDAFYAWIQAREGNGSAWPGPVMTAYEEIDPSDQLAQNLLGASEW
jgi:hypothetical protein